jgi:hypothetical protein
MGIDARTWEDLVQVSLALKFPDQVGEGPADPGCVQVRGGHIPALALRPLRARGCAAAQARRSLSQVCQQLPQGVGFA